MSQFIPIEEMEHAYRMHVPLKADCDERTAFEYSVA